jgi:hypothetical protein
LVLHEGPTQLTQEYADETLRHFFDAGNPVLKRANVPPPFVIVQRINLGLYAVLAGLRATADWRRMADELWPWVNASPSTELGRAEAAWRATRAPTPPGAPVRPRSAPPPGRMPARRSPAARGPHRGS